MSEGKLEPKSAISKSFHYCHGGLGLRRYGQLLYGRRREGPNPVPGGPGSGSWPVLLPPATPSLDLCLAFGPFHKMLPGIPSLPSPQKIPALHSFEHHLRLITPRPPSPDPHGSGLQPPPGSQTLTCSPVCPERSPKPTPSHGFPILGMAPQSTSHWVGPRGCLHPFPLHPPSQPVGSLTPSFLLCLLSTHTPSPAQNSSPPTCTRARLSLHLHSSPIQAQRYPPPTPGVDSVSSLLTGLSWTLKGKVEAGVQSPLWALAHLSILFSTTL